MRSRTVPFAGGLPAWARLAEAWPVDRGAAWLRAEFGRVTARHQLTIVEDDGVPLAAASWLLLAGAEERRGYSAYDLLLGTELDMSLRSVADREPSDRRAAALRTALSPDVLDPSATVVIPGTSEPGVIWNCGVIGPRQSRVLAHLIEAVTESASGMSARTVVFTNVPHAAEWAPLRRELDRAAFDSGVQAPTTSIEIPAGGIDEFLAGRPRHQRKNSRREMRIFAAATDRVVVQDADRLLDDDIVHLLRHRYVKYGLVTSRAAVLDRLTRAQDLPGLTVLVAERDGRACAFKALVRDRRFGRLLSRFSGCEDNKFYDYFNMSFYEPLRYGAAAGFHAMSLGTESYRAKLARGALIEPRSTFLWVADRRLRGPLRQACELRGDVERRRLLAELPNADEEEVASWCTRPRSG